MANPISKAERRAEVKRLSDIQKQKWDEKFGRTPAPSTPSNLVQLTPENIQAIEKSGGVQAGTPLAKALEGKQIQVVAAPGTRGVAEGTPVAFQQFQKGAYYTIHPSPTTQVTQQYQIPPTTTSAMGYVQDYKPLVQQAYNQQVQQAYQDQLRNIDIQYDYRLGKSGTYKTKEGKIYVSKIFPFKDRTIVHEVGHKLDLGSRETRDYSKYKEASRNLIPDFLENMGYKKENVKYEYYARAFAKYIKNPEKFKQNYPEVASEFERKLDIVSTQATPIDQTKVSAISPSQISTKDIIFLGSRGDLTPINPPDFPRRETISGMQPPLPIMRIKKSSSYYGIGGQTPEQYAQEQKAVMETGENLTPQERVMLGIDYGIVGATTMAEPVYGKGGGTEPYILPEWFPTGGGRGGGGGGSGGDIPIIDIIDGGGGGGGGGIIDLGGVTSPHQQFFNQQQQNYNAEMQELDRQYRERGFNWYAYNQKAKAIYNKYTTALTNYEEEVRKAEQLPAQQQKLKEEFAAYIEVGLKSGEIKREFQPAPSGQMGLGGKYVYRDLQGDIIGGDIQEFQVLKSTITPESYERIYGEGSSLLQSGMVIGGEGTFGGYTAGDITKIIMVPVSITKGAILTGAGIILSEPVSQIISSLDKKYLLQPTTIGGKFAKGIFMGAGFTAISRNVPAAGSFIGSAFGTEIGLGLLESPYETGKALVTSPETYGFIASGFLPSFKVTLPKGRTFDDILIKGEAPQAFNFIEGKIADMNINKETFGITYISPALKLPIAYGKIQAIGQEAPGLESGLRKDIAKAATEEGGYIVGSTTIEAKYGKKLFRIGSDIDIGVTKEGLIDLTPKITKRIIPILEKYPGTYEVTSYTKSQLKDIKNIISETPGGVGRIAIVKKGGKPIVEIVVRPDIDSIVNIGDIRFREASQVIEDKMQIARVAKKGIEKIPKEKLQKTLRDIELVKQAEEILSQPRTIYEGLYFRYGEAKAKPLIGFGEEGLILGMPKPSQLPSIKFVTFTEEGLPKLARGNIASYPASAFETAIITEPNILKAIFKGSITAEKDIMAIQLTKEARRLLKEQRSAFLEKFPEETKILSPEETRFTIEFAKRNQKLFERIYGSFTDVAQMPKELKREVHDIELEFKTEIVAKAFAEKYVGEAKKKGFKLKVIEDQGLGIYKGKEKAIELKYAGDESALELSKGYRYGYKEYRKPTSIEGITAQKQYEQLIRKSATATTLYKEIQKEKIVNIAEAPLHRAKDIPDVYREIVSLSKSYAKIKVLREKVFGKGARGLILAEEFRALYKEVPQGISPERAKLREEVIQLFKEIPQSKIELTNELSQAQKGIGKEGKSIISPYKKQRKERYFSMSAIASSFISPSIIVSRSFSISPISISPYKSPYKSPSPYPSPSPSPYPSPSPSPYPSPYKSPYPSPRPYPSKSPSPYPYPEVFKEPKIILETYKEERNILKQVPTFSVQIRRRGKYRPAFANVTLAEAKRLGSEKALMSLARTFRIKPTGKTREIFGIDEEQMIPELRKFREFRIKKGKRIATPLQFTQLTEFNLKSLSEQAEIKLARKSKGYTLD